MWIFCSENAILESEVTQKNKNPPGLSSIEESDIDIKTVIDARSLSRWIITYQIICDKNISNCVEALIGAYLVECGRKGAVLLMEWFGFEIFSQNEWKIRNVNVQHFNQTHENISEFGRILNSPIESTGFCPPPVLNPNDDIFVNLYNGRKYSEFENIIGYSFKNRSFLLQAFTHESYSKSRKWCYER